MPYALWPSKNAAILAVQEWPSAHAKHAKHAKQPGHQKLCSSRVGRCLASLSAPTTAKTSSDRCLAGTPQRQHSCARRGLQEPGMKTARTPRDPTDPPSLQSSEPRGAQPPGLRPQPPLRRPKPQREFFSHVETSQMSSHSRPAWQRAWPGPKPARSQESSSSKALARRHIEHRRIETRSRRTFLCPLGPGVWPRRGFRTESNWRRISSRHAAGVY